MIVAGFGFRAEATQDSLADALAQTGAQPDALATIADKAHSLASLATRMNLPLHTIPQAKLPADTPTDSPASRTHRATGSVAEATALAAAGPGARLITLRTISTDRMATCAIAEGTDP
ncbi:cobalamin biosynthesis protein CbiG [Rhodobacteraceae bacterium THAF1]|uniref:cobalamin biosynthesis protein n=1 Tax=Palleronia sp. THAF1 TaxID=2587842 RepID=UPI000F3FCC43|nr:cobalamin biosynthesis protein [Palleronia sp. THAF1]QFU09729.1 cobalamin biosynthesis protein CbiG [Palleronia sp. THAF1]VDC17368.1 cobalamin biosynthesis protein CbiG [Rhodobacteraceae bacterium THAF1]